MKSVLIIGMGRFGRHLAKKMMELGNDVMVVDKNAELIDQIASNYTDSNIGDCTNERVLHELGINNFDICFVAIGDDFQSSLVVTSLLKKLGAKHIVAKAKQDIQAELLKQIGADEVVYPERDIAEKLAVRYNASNIFDYIQLTSEYSIYEIPVMQDWIGESITNMNIRRKFMVNIIAVKNGNQLRPIPGPDYVFVPGDHIVIVGKSADVFKISSHN